MNDKGLFTSKISLFYSVHEIHSWTRCLVHVCFPHDIQHGISYFFSFKSFNLTFLLAQVASTFRFCFPGNGCDLSFTIGLKLQSSTTSIFRIVSDFRPDKFLVWINGFTKESTQRE